eukprot:478899-Rhodomonas_salina.1
MEGGVQVCELFSECVSDLYDLAGPSGERCQCQDARPSASPEGTVGRGSQGAPVEAWMGTPGVA